MGDSDMLLSIGVVHSFHGFAVVHCTNVQYTTPSTAAGYLGHFQILAVMTLMHCYMHL